MRGVVFSETRHQCLLRAQLAAQQPLFFGDTPSLVLQVRERLADLQRSGLHHARLWPLGDHLVPAAPHGFEAALHRLQFAQHLQGLLQRFDGAPSPPLAGGGLCLLSCQSLRQLGAFGGQLLPLRRDALEDAGQVRIVEAHLSAAAIDLRLQLLHRLGEGRES